MEVYKVFKHALMHESAFPRPLVFVGGSAKSLNAMPSPPKPFGDDGYDFDFHMFVDASVGSPPACDAAIADGTERATTLHGKSYTGIITMLAGAPLQVLCLRQHLVAPDSHTAEVTAAGTAINHMVIPFGDCCTSSEFLCWSPRLSTAIRLRPSLWPVMPGRSSGRSGYSAVRLCCAKLFTTKSSCLSRSRTPTMRRTH